MFSFLFMSFISFLFIMYNLCFFVSFEFNNFDFNMLSLNNFNLTFYVDFMTLLFLIMVLMVTCLVSLYGEVYMEHYNNKKFFMLMLMFFGFMSLLSSSASFVVFFLGWDGLGISSLGLIMFYPNKNTLYNSILTMFFNRLGDVFLIISMGMIIYSYSNFIFLNSKFNILCLSLLLFCSLTKSAQFPMSSWLPAAMSAPTPISAMVHSSTLVTAGLLLNHLMIYWYFSLGLNLYLLFISTFTFMVGGLLGVLEMDLKKIIAFSTMSQISMIMLFCSIGFIKLSLIHMFFHAFFKTLLFVSSGVMFMYYFSKQAGIFLNLTNYSSEYLSSIFFLSIYSMSGFIFSSSFFSKDVVLEEFCSGQFSPLFIFLVVGSILTMMYSSKLMLSMYSFMNLNKNFLHKNFSMGFIFIFVIFVVYSGNLYKDIFFTERFPMVLFSDLMIMMVLIFSPIFFNTTTKKNKYMNLFFQHTYEVFFMKFLTYNLPSKILSNTLMKFIYSDKFIFSPYYFKNLMLFHKSKFYSSSMYSLIFSFFILMA